MASASIREEGEPVFQIAPMIDILLVLLVFFMSISSAEVLQQSRDVNLPVATEAKKSAGSAQTVVNVLHTPVSNTAAIVVEDQAMSHEQLLAHLKAKLSLSPQSRVLLRVDREIRYESLRPLLDAVGQAGISDVTFSVVDRASAPESPKP